MPPPTPLPPPPSSSPQRAFNRVSLSASQRSQCAQLKSMAWEVRSGGTTPGTAHDASSARLRVDVEPWEAGSLVLLCPVMGAASPSARASNHSAASAASATKARHDLRRRRALAQLDEAGPQHERPNYSLASPQHERPSPSDGSAARAQGPPAHSKGTPSHKLRLEIDPQFFELLDAAELGAAWHDAYAHAEHAGLPRDACNPFHGGGGAGDGGHDGGTASEGRGDGRGEGRGEGHGEEGGASDGELPGGATTPSTTSYVPAGTAGVRLRALPAARRTNFTPDLFVTYQDAAPRAPVYAAASEESPRLRPDAPLPRGAPSSSGQGRASLRALESLPRMPQGRPSLWPCRLRTGASCAACSLFPPHAGGALRVRRDGARAAAGGAAGVIRLGWLRAPALVAARSPRLQAVVAARGAARPAGRPGSGATRRGRNVSVAVPGRERALRPAPAARFRRPLASRTVPPLSQTRHPPFSAHACRWRRPRSLPPRSLRRWRFRSAPSRSSCCCSASFFGRDTASPGATLTQPRPARWTAATTAALAAAAAARAVTRAVARRTGASSCHRLPRALTRARSPLRLARAAAPLPAPSIPVPEYMLLRWSRKVF